MAPRTTNTDGKVPKRPRIPSNFCPPYQVVNPTGEDLLKRFLKGVEKDGQSDATLPCLPDFNGTYQSQINTPGDAMKSLLAWAISFNQRIDPHHDRVPLVQRIQTTIHTLVLSTMNPERNTFDAVEAERQWYNILYGHALPFLFDATVGKEKGNMLTSAAEDLHKWLDGLNDNPKEEDVQVLVDKMAKMRLGSRKDRGRKCRSGRNLHRTDRR